MKQFKVIGVLLLVGTLSACAATPTAVERTITESELYPGLKLERITMSDEQGTTTYDISVPENQPAEYARHNKASTAQQDNLQTFIGTATAPVVNVLGAHTLKNRSDSCGSGGCGSGGGQQFMQVQVESSSGSTSGTSGCATCGLVKD